MTNQKPKFRLEDLDIKTSKGARVYQQHSLKSENSVDQDRTFCDYNCRCQNECGPECGCNGYCNSQS